MTKRDSNTGCVVANPCPIRDRNEGSEVDRSYDVDVRNTESWVPRVATEECLALRATCNLHTSACAASGSSMLG